MKYCKPWRIFFLLSLCLLSLHAYAEEKSAIKLQKEISELSNTLENSRQQSKALKNEMSKLDQQLNSISQKQHQTETKITDTEKTLSKNNRKRNRLTKELAKEKDALAQQLQALYLAGEQSHLRLLFRQDEPSDISRTMKYLEYLNNARIKQIKDTQNTIKEINQIESQITKDRESLKLLAKELIKQKEEIRVLLNQRTASRKQIQTSIANDEKALAKLKQQEASLQTVVASIPEPAVQDKAEPEPTGKKVSTHDVPSKPFTTLRGKLSWPLDGNVQHRYRSKRSGQLRWNGVFIKAKGGSKIKAVAQGKVVFSDWMDGYGYLTIIQHDKNYLSLYAHNRALYKKEGEKVNANEVIAAAGNTGSLQTNGLYFEIRKGQNTVDPEKWIRK